jgi:hypothetical protein
MKNTNLTENFGDRQVKEYEVYVANEVRIGV